MRSHIIENWEAQDEPPHLKIIRDRLLHRGQFTVRMLEIYRQIFQRAITADGSLEQTELLLSGLVTRKNDELRIFNRIYREIFNQDWVEKMLNEQRPYAEELKFWLASNFQNSSLLLRGRELKTALSWATDKNLTNEDYQFLSASQKSEQRKVRKRLTIALALAIPFFTIGGGILWAISTSCPENQIKSEDGTCVAGAIVADPERTSSGEYPILSIEPSSALERGIDAFSSGNYAQAIEFFKEAVTAEPINPEPKIYLNNAIARQNGSLFNLAAVVSAEDNGEISQEILRGVAEAQNRFNQEDGLEGRLLEIIIANDGNNPDVATRIAKQLEVNPAVLGVIGHGSVPTTVAAMTIYEKAQIALVPPIDTKISQELEVNLYEEAAATSWQEDASWRTSSYDATQSLIDALSTDATRETVFHNIVRGKERK